MTRMIMGMMMIGKMAVMIRMMMVMPLTNIIITLHCLFQGVDLSKMIAVGDFICHSLNRKTNSRVAQARGSQL